MSASRQLEVYIAQRSSMSLLYVSHYFIGTLSWRALWNPEALSVYKIVYSGKSSRFVNENNCFIFMELAEGFEPPTL